MYNYQIGHAHSKEVFLKPKGDATGSSTPGGICAAKTNRVRKVMRINPLLLVGSPLVALCLFSSVSGFRSRLSSKGIVPRPQEGVRSLQLGPLHLKERDVDGNVKPVVDGDAEQQEERSRELQSILLLNGVAVLFGSQHAVIKSTLDVFSFAVSSKFVALSVISSSFLSSFGQCYPLSAKILARGVNEDYR